MLRLEFVKQKSGKILSVVVAVLVCSNYFKFPAYSQIRTDVLSKESVSQKHPTGLEYPAIPDFISAEELIEKYKNLKLEIQDGKLILPQDFAKELFDYNLGQTIDIQIRPSTKRFIVSGLLNPKEDVARLYIDLLQEMFDKSSKVDPNFYAALSALQTRDNKLIPSNALNLRIGVDNFAPEINVEDFDVPNITPVTISFKWTSITNKFLRPNCSGAIESFNGKPVLLISAKHCFGHHLNAIHDNADPVDNVFISYKSPIFGAYEIDPYKFFVLQSGDFIIVVEKSIQALETAQKRIDDMYRAGEYLKKSMQKTTWSEETKKPPDFIGPLSHEDQQLPSIESHPRLREYNQKSIPLVTRTAFSPVEGFVQNELMYLPSQLNGFMTSNITYYTDTGLPMPEMSVRFSSKTLDFTVKGSSGGIVMTYIPEFKKITDSKGITKFVEQKTPVVVGVNIASAGKPVEFGSIPNKTSFGNVAYVDYVDYKNLTRQIKEYKNTVKSEATPVSILSNLYTLDNQNLNIGNFGVLNKVQLSDKIFDTMSELVKDPEIFTLAKPEAVKKILQISQMAIYKEDQKDLVTGITAQFQKRFKKNLAVDPITKRPVSNTENFINSSFVQASRHDTNLQSIMLPVAKNLGDTYFTTLQKHYKFQ